MAVPPVGGAGGAPSASSAFALRRVAGRRRDPLAIGQREGRDFGVRVHEIHRQRRGDLQLALRNLRHHDAVLAPARDGGYVLIGMGLPVPELVTDIPWGRAAVMAATSSSLATSMRVAMVWKRVSARSNSCWAD